MALKILVADDSETNRLLLSLTLRRQGCEADIVANGREAADLFGRYKYDLVFLDLNMPVMDGLATARRILQYRKNVPVYAISGFPSPDAEAQFEDAGIRRCLIKPLDREKLAEVAAECGLEIGGLPPATAEGEVPARLLKAYAHELRARAKACAVHLENGGRKGLLRETHTIRALGQMLKHPKLEALALRAEQDAAAMPLADISLTALEAACAETAAAIDAGI